MEWLDEAIVLSARPHGETAAIVMLLTPSYGVHAGLMPGGQGRHAQPVLQPGNRVRARWRARLAEQLGTYALELISPHAARWLDEPEVLAVIASACALTEAGVPERQAMGQVYAGLATLLGLSDVDLFGPAYVKWELGLLKVLGFGLDLSRCAVSGGTENLAYVSPRSGRAVSAAAGEPFQEKLLVLPGFLIGSAGWTISDVLQGLELTGHFLRTHVFLHPHSRLIAKPGDLPRARDRLHEFYRKLCADRATDVA